MSGEVLVNPKRKWSNAHAEMQGGIERWAEGYEYVRYQKVRSTDRVIIPQASEYVRRLAAAIHFLDGKSKINAQHIQKESDHRAQETLIGNQDRLELQITTIIGQYFLQLQMECDEWIGSPIFTLRDTATVVVTKQSILSLKARCGKPYDLSEWHSISRVLALSPFAKKM